MALPRDTYQIFADIVGPENITEETVILDGYTFNWLVEFNPGPGTRANTWITDPRRSSFRAAWRKCRPSSGPAMNMG